MKYRNIASAYKLKRRRFSHIQCGQFCDDQFTILFQDSIGMVIMQGIANK